MSKQASNPPPPECWRPFPPPAPPLVVRSWLEDEQVFKVINKVSEEYQTRLESLCRMFSRRVLHHLESPSNPGPGILMQTWLCTAFRKRLAVVEIRLEGTKISVQWGVLAPELASEEED